MSIKHLRFSSIIFATILGTTGSALAAPEITSVTLGTAVDATHFVTITTPNLSPGSSESSIFVMPGQTAGNTVSSAPDY